MPNRIIKESICTSDQIDRLTPFEEVCFYRLIVNADDYGRCDARASVLRSRLFPLRDISNQQLEEAIDALEAAGLIARYQVDGRAYLFLPGWHRNQKVRTKRVKCPPPPGWQEDGASQSNAEVKQIDADMQQTCADLKQIDADVQQTCADLKQIDAGMQQTCADLKQIDAGVQQLVSDCCYNPIQSESQSKSESESVSVSQSEPLKKEIEGIYNSSWRYSPRARAATAQILVDQYHRERLPCTGIRDLFVVVERALELGVSPDEITRTARTLKAPAFAATYMSREVPAGNGCRAT